MLKHTNFGFHVLLTLLGAVLFLPFLGDVHLLDWDEINFAESAREMLVTGNFWQVQVNYEPFWEKPPLFLWIQAGSMKLFGVNEFAARLPNALIGIITLNLLFYLGRKLDQAAIGKWWAFIYLASFTPQFYFHTGIIDPLFNLWIFLSLYQLYRVKEESSMLRWLYAGLFLGLAVLTKGPVAGLVVALVLIVVWAFNRFRFWFSWLQFGIFTITSLAVASVWFLPELLRNGVGFLSNFLAYQVDLMRNPVASHGQPWFYHAVVLLIGCFPASILALSRFSKSSGSSFEFWMKTMFWVVLILFSLVTTKIVHYSSLCYFPLTYLAAVRLHQWRHSQKFTRMEAFGLVSLSVFWLLVFVAVPLFGSYRLELLERYPNLIKDAFTMENLQAPVDWPLEYVGIALSGALVLFWFLNTLLRSKRLDGLKSLLFLGGYFAFYLLIFVPRIEGHTQNSIIGFYKTIDQEDCYVDVYKFKSYAHYYYTGVKPLTSSDKLYDVKRDILDSLGANTRLELNEEGRKEYSNREMEWYLSGNIDKPVYLVSQPRKRHELEAKKGFNKVFDQGGYTVFVRKPNN
ncbi:MAG: glycosyltransferase family 39 protein [Bacteroidia bacterium]|nr:glycosyltransferase family 39 protein [Bacteroidia bacterium]